jgi:hypothetical protein
VAESSLDAYARHHQEMTATESKLRGLVAAAHKALKSFDDAGFGAIPLDVSFAGWPSAEEMANAAAAYREAADRARGRLARPLRRTQAGGAGAEDIGAASAREVAHGAGSDGVC